jgi:hypothetical protein
MAIDLDLTKEEIRAALRAFAPWSIHVTLEDADGHEVGSFHDCGFIVSFSATDEEAARVAQALRGIAPVVAAGVRPAARLSRSGTPTRHGRWTRWLTGRFGSVARGASDGADPGSLVVPGPGVGTGAAAAGLEARQVTAFEGVSADARHGVEEPVGPYEFWTDDGVHVFLHDAQFAGMLVGADHALRFWFRFDPECVPSGAEATPVVELAFEGVHLTGIDPEPIDDEVVAYGDVGQVLAFSWDGAVTFDLQTMTLRVTFIALRMRARLVAEFRP